VAYSLFVSVGQAQNYHRIDHHDSELCCLILPLHVISPDLQTIHGLEYSCAHVGMPVATLYK